MERVLALLHKIPFLWLIIFDESVALCTKRLHSEEIKPNHTTADEKRTKMRLERGTV